MRAVIDVETLRNYLSDPDWFVFDARFSLQKPDAGQEAYQSGHIPSAQYAHLDRDLSQPLSPHSGRHPLPTAAQFQTTMRKWGVNAASNLVVYDSSRFAFAARFWWLCRYFGHDRVWVLDGGLDAWMQQGNPLDTDVPEFAEGNFVAQPRDLQVMNREAILSRPEDLVLIDAREAPRYQGIHEPIDPIAGHIEGAFNVPWQHVTDERGFLKPREVLASLFKEVPEGNRVVYCGSGVTACVVQLALFELDQPMRMYPGSWSQWCSYMLENG
ncbi:MAG: sulfurtransferase [Acidobacteria bacterium]|nr:sulfurtransferase [Acidobacteriota bacterium]